MEQIFTTAGLTSLLALIALEIILGIDNIIFLAILTSKVAPELRKKARFIGLSLALVLRVLLLFSISWLTELKDDLFVIFKQGISGRDLVLLFGGLFLVWKATKEIHDAVDLPEDPDQEKVMNVKGNFMMVLVQIAVVDLVFSLDSVITAVGLGTHMSIMVISVLAAVVFMMLFTGVISHFVERHPTVKMLALSFLILVGIFLIADSVDVHINRNFLYFAMAFSAGVETLNIRARKVAELAKNSKV